MRVSRSARVAVPAGAHTCGPPHCSSATSRSARAAAAHPTPRAIHRRHVRTPRLRACPSARATNSVFQSPLPIRADRPLEIPARDRRVRRRRVRPLARRHPARTPSAPRTRLEIAPGADRRRHERALRIRRPAVETRAARYVPARAGAARARVTSKVRAARRIPPSRWRRRESRSVAGRLAQQRAGGLLEDPPPGAARFSPFSASKWRTTLRTRVAEISMPWRAQTSRAAAS